MLIKIQILNRLFLLWLQLRWWRGLSSCLCPPVKTGHLAQPTLKSWSSCWATAQGSCVDRPASGRCLPPELVENLWVYTDNKQTLWSISRYLHRLAFGFGLGSDTSSQYYFPTLVISGYRTTQMFLYVWALLMFIALKTILENITYFLSVFPVAIDFPSFPCTMNINCKYIRTCILIRVMLLCRNVAQTYELNACF